MPRVNNTNLKSLAKPPTGRCNPINPGPDNVNINLFVAARGNELTIVATDQACGASFSRTYRATAEDDETFILPDDLHPATLAMLHGVCLRFMQLARHGFDRES